MSATPRSASSSPLQDGEANGSSAAADTATNNNISHGSGPVEPGTLVTRWPQHKRHGTTTTTPGWRSTSDTCSHGGGAGPLLVDAAAAAAAASTSNTTAPPLRISTRRLQVFSYVLAELSSASTLLADYTKALLNLSHRLVGAWQAITAAAVARTRYEHALVLAVHQTQQTRRRDAATRPARALSASGLHGTRRQRSLCSESRATAARGSASGAPPAPRLRRRSGSRSHTHSARTTKLGEAHSAAAGAAAGRSHALASVLPHAARTDASLHAHSALDALPPLPPSTAQASRVLPSHRRRSRDASRARRSVSGGGNRRVADADATARRQRRSAAARRDERRRRGFLRATLPLLWLDAQEAEDTAGQHVEHVRQLVLNALYQQFLAVAVDRSFHDLALHHWLTPVLAAVRRETGTDNCDAARRRARRSSSRHACRAAGGGGDASPPPSSSSTFPTGVRGLTLQGVGPLRHARHRQTAVQVGADLQLLRRVLRRARITVSAPPPPSTTGAAHAQAARSLAIVGEACRDAPGRRPNMPSSPSPSSPSSRPIKRHRRSPPPLRVDTAATPTAWPQCPLTDPDEHADDAGSHPLPNIMKEEDDGTHSDAYAESARPPTGTSPNREQHINDSPSRSTTWEDVLASLVCDPTLAVPLPLQSFVQACMAFDPTHSAFSIMSRCVLLAQHVRNEDDEQRTTPCGADGAAPLPPQLPRDDAGAEYSGLFYVVIARRAVGACTHAVYCFGNHKFIFVRCYDTEALLRETAEDADSLSSLSSSSSASCGRAASAFASSPPSCASVGEEEATVRRRRRRGGTSVALGRDALGTPDSTPSHVVPPTSSTTSSPWRSGPGRSVGSPTPLPRLDPHSPHTAGSPLMSGRVSSGGGGGGAARSGSISVLTTLDAHRLRRDANEDSGTSTPAPTSPRPPPLTPPPAPYADAATPPPPQSLPTSHTHTGRATALSKPALSLASRGVVRGGAVPRKCSATTLPPLARPLGAHRHGSASPCSSSTQSPCAQPCASPVRPPLLPQSHTGAVANEQSRARASGMGVAKGGGHTTSPALNISLPLLPTTSVRDHGGGGDGGDGTLPFSVTTHTPSSSSSSSVDDQGPSRGGAQRCSAAAETRAKEDEEDEEDALDATETQMYVVMHSPFCSRTGEDGAAGSDAARTAAPTATFPPSSPTSVGHAAAASVTADTRTQCGEEKGECPSTSTTWPAVPHADVPMSRFEQQVLLPPGSGQERRIGGGSGGGIRRGHVAAVPAFSAESGTSEAEAATFMGTCAATPTPSPPPAEPSEGDMAFAAELYARLQFWNLRGQDRSAYIDPTWTQAWTTTTTAAAAAVAARTATTDVAETQDVSTASVQRRDKDGGDAEAQHHTHATPALACATTAPPTTVNMQRHSPRCQSDAAAGSTSPNPSEEPAPAAARRLRVELPLCLLQCRVGTIELTDETTAMRSAARRRRKRQRQQHAEERRRRRRVRRGASAAEADVNTCGRGEGCEDSSTCTSSSSDSESDFGEDTTEVPSTTTPRWPPSVSVNARGRELLAEALQEATELVVCAVRESRAHAGYHDLLHQRCPPPFPAAYAPNMGGGSAAVQLPVCSTVPPPALDAAGTVSAAPTSTWLTQVRPWMPAAQTCTFTVPTGTLSRDERNPFAFDTHEHLGTSGTVQWLQGDVMHLEAADSDSTNSPWPRSEENAASRGPRRRWPTLPANDQQQWRCELLKSEFRLARSQRLDCLLVDSAHGRPIAALTLVPSRMTRGLANPSEGGSDSANDEDGEDGRAQEKEEERREGESEGSAVRRRRQRAATHAGAQEVVQRTVYTVVGFSHYVAPLWRHLREEKALLVDMDRTLIDNAVMVRTAAERHRHLLHVHRAMEAASEMGQEQEKDGEAGGPESYGEEEARRRGKLRLHNPCLLCRSVEQPSAPTSTRFNQAPFRLGSNDAAYLTEAELAASVCGDGLFDDSVCAQETTTRSTSAHARRSKGDEGRARRLSAGRSRPASHHGPRPPQTERTDAEVNAAAVPSALSTSHPQHMLRRFLRRTTTQRRQLMTLHYEECGAVRYVAAASTSGLASATETSRASEAATAPTTSSSQPASPPCVFSDVVYVRPGARQFIYHAARQWNIPVVLVTKSTRPRTEAIVRQVLDPHGILFPDQRRTIVTADEMLSWMGEEEEVAGAEEEEEDGEATVAAPVVRDTDRGCTDANEEAGPRGTPPVHREAGAGALVSTKATSASAATTGASAAERLARCHKKICRVLQSVVDAPAMATARRAWRAPAWSDVAGRLPKPRSVVVLDDAPQVWAEEDWPCTMHVAPYTLARVDPREYFTNHGYTSSVVLSCLFSSKCLVCCEGVLRDPSPHTPLTAASSSPCTPSSALSRSGGDGSVAGAYRWPHCVCVCPTSHLRDIAGAERQGDAEDGHGLGRADTRRSMANATSTVSAVLTALLWRLTRGDQQMQQAPPLLLTASPSEAATAAAASTQTAAEEGREVAHAVRRRARHRGARLEQHMRPSSDGSDVPAVAATQPSAPAEHPLAETAREAAAQQRHGSRRLDGLCPPSMHTAEAVSGLSPSSISVPRPPHTPRDSFTSSSLSTVSSSSSTASVSPSLAAEPSAWAGDLDRLAARAAARGRVNSLSRHEGTDYGESISDSLSPTETQMTAPSMPSTPTAFRVSADSRGDPTRALTGHVDGEDEEDGDHAREGVAAGGGPSSSSWWAGALSNAVGGLPTAARHRVSGGGDAEVPEKKSTVRGGAPVLPSLDQSPPSGSVTPYLRNYTSTMAGTRSSSSEVEDVVPLRVCPPGTSKCDVGNGEEGVGLDVQRGRGGTAGNEDAEDAVVCGVSAVVSAIASTTPRFATASPPTGWLRSVTATEAAEDVVPLPCPPSPSPNPVSSGSATEGAQVSPASAAAPVLLAELHRPQPRRYGDADGDVEDVVPL